MKTKRTSLANALWWGLWIAYGIGLAFYPLEFHYQWWHTIVLWGLATLLFALIVFFQWAFDEMYKSAKTATDELAKALEIAHTNHLRVMKLQDRVEQLQNERLAAQTPEGPT